MRISLKDIADRVGVTPQLVSFYLNHQETTRVKKETREKIDVAIRQLNYRANTVGRALSTGKTRTIGLIMGGFADRKRSCYVHMLMNEAKKRGYHLLIAITNYDRAEEREALEHMLSRQVDGIIYTLSLDDDGEMAERLQALHFPILLHSPYRLENFDTAVGATVSRSADDKQLAVITVNRALEPETLTLAIPGIREASAEVLTGPSPYADNETEPDTVKVIPLEVRQLPSGAQLTLPPHSLTGISLQLK